MQDVDSNYGTIRSQWETIDWCSEEQDICVEEECTEWRYGRCRNTRCITWETIRLRPQMPDCWVGGYGTYQGSGLELGVDILRASTDDQSLKVLILISDGAPNCMSGSSSCISARAQGGRDAAAYADANDMSIYSISFNYPYNSTQSAYMESLIRGYGTFHETPTETELPGILREVAAQIPVALVQ
jgi:hypothetical protein